MPIRLALLMLASLGAHASAQDVVIYRCKDAKGQVALRDSSCPLGQDQETRNLRRPRDPVPVAPKAAPDSVPPPERSSAPVERVVYRTPPQPMYECLTGEGERYTSDTGEGRLRWVPYAGVGYAVVPRPAWPRPPHPHPPPDHPSPPHGGRPLAWAVPVGAWVRDECHVLPQRETCARLSDRRYEILRRYGAAMPSERRELDLEQRAIDARLANDCGNP